MEYPFKDLMPLDEATARDGYYEDWTHLDPEVFYSLTQISEYIKTKGYGVDVRLLIAQLAEHFGLKSKQIIDLANLLQQQFANLEGVTQSFTNNINSLVAQMEADKEAVIANATVDSEVILARGGKATLGQRLDETTAQLAEIEKLKTYVTPELFGAVGDGITDDTIALQNAINHAINNDLKFVAIGKYRTTSTLLIAGNFHLFGNFDFEKSTIIYEGTDSAVLLQGYNGATFKFGFIHSPNGNCIEFYSEVGTADRTQYCNVSFLRLIANQSHGKCIYIHNSGTGWCNNNVVSGGEFVGGYYGVYIKGGGVTTTYTINGWQFYNMGFEGNERNIYIEGTAENPVNGIEFNSIRFEEYKIILAQINNHVSNIIINVVSGDIKRSQLSFLNGTIPNNILVNGIMVSEDASVLLGYGFNYTQGIERYITYFTANTAENINKLNNEAATTVLLTNATGAMNIERKGNLCILKFNDLVVESAYNEILNNAVNTLYRPKTLTNGVAVTSDGKCGRIWIRTNGTLALSIPADAIGSGLSGELVYFV